MADDRVPPDSPGVEILALAQRVRPLRDDEKPRSLAVSLQTTVDSLRQLHTTFGVRPYRVFLVHLLWSGGRPGVGDPVEVSRVEILPTPLVRDMSAVGQVLASTGLQEDGQLTVSQISTRFAEDDLMGRTPDLQDPALPRTSRGGIQFFWEIVQDRRIDPRGVPRRFAPVSAPSLSRDSFQWTVTLTRQDFDSGRGGAMQPRNAF